jgi:hypothetical protein
MTSTSSCRPRHRRWKIPVAILAASAAFVGGQALVPTPAAAMIDDGSGMECLFWIDCITQTETGGGGGEGGLGSGGGSGVLTKPPEVIVVTGTKPNPKCGEPGAVCVSVGGSGVPKPPTDRDSKPQETGGDRGHPSCKRPSAGAEKVCSGSKKEKKEPEKTEGEKKLEEEAKHAKYCVGLKATTRALEHTKRKVEAGGKYPDVIWNEDGKATADPDEAKKTLLDWYAEAIKVSKEEYESECRED